MSILSGFLKTKKHRKMADGNYKLQSEWTSASTVEMADGNTAETNLGAIQGITDSLTATSSNIALSAKAGNNLQGQIDTVNSNLSSFGKNIASLFSVNPYTVPCDGFVCIFANPKTTATEHVIITGSSFGTIKCVAVNGNATNTFYPCRKGNILKTGSTDGLESNSLAVFIPLHD